MRSVHTAGVAASCNFTDEGGTMAVLSYTVTLPEAGRYYVWVRAYSTTT